MSKPFEKVEATKDGLKVTLAPTPENCENCGSDGWVEFENPTPARTITIGDQVIEFPEVKGIKELTFCSSHSRWECSSCNKGCDR